MAGITGTDENHETELKPPTSQQCNGDGHGPAQNGHDEVVMNGDSSMESSTEERRVNGEGDGDKKEEGDGDRKEGEECDHKDGKDQEIFVIQDTSFTIEIAPPGIDPFELPVSSLELVQEIHQLLMDREDCCHRTCFSLQLDGITLDNFAELKAIEGLKDGSLIKVVEEPYTVREARIHVRHVRDLLKSVDSADAFNGVDCSSLSYLNHITAGDILEKKRGKPDSIDCTPPDFVMPGAKDRPLLPLHPGLREMKGPQCLKVLTYSGWNPPPGNRKMHGDLLYLYVVTLEDKRYHITASTRGFYLNQSTEDNFNPRASQPKYLSHSLIDLMNQISPLFKKNFAVLLRKRSMKHPFERVPTPYQVYSWLAPTPEHQVDYIRAEDAFSTRLGYEEHIPGQTRDWNEEIQTTRELPHTNLPERLIRERAIFKVHSDFVAAATRGAMAVIDGNVMAINPGEDAKMQMFIWNNIFFSLGFDVKDHYKDFGGDAAAYAAPGNDLQGVKAYFNLDPKGLFTLGTVVVDYRGYRVTAQSIIPGILEREQEQSVVYGSVDFGKTVVTSDKYRELLQNTASQLKIRAHKVLNSKNEEIELLSSIECKGIVGNDQRHYILDLLRTFPPDVNYLPVEEEEVSQEMKEHGYPRQHRHKLPCLRQELIEAFVENRYVAFVRHAAYQFQQLQLLKQAKSKDKESEASSDIKIKPPPEKAVPEVLVPENGESKEKEKNEEDMVTAEAKKIVETLTATDSQTFEENTKDIVKKAARAVGSLSDTEFSMSFNPDIFQPHVVHVDPEGETFQREKQLVKDAAEFMVLHQIPTLISDCLDHSSSPIDGITLSEAMHARGINMRYLGKVAEMFAKYSSVGYVFSIAISELICRGAKHMFKGYMQGVDMMNLSSAISHFLNCLLGSYPSPHAQVNAEELQTKARKKNKRRNKQSSVFAVDNSEWVSDTPKTLWKKIVDEVADYYGYTLECDSMESATERYGLQRVSLLRAFCRAAGVQLLLREVNLEVRNKQLFYEDDIINTTPIVKHISPRATDAFHFFSSGQSKIQAGSLREGYELISEALNLLNNVYGAMHSEIAACLRLLARLNYIMGDYPEAMSFQQRAVLMSERVLGVDHPNTITEYAHLALYCFANNQVPNALRLMYRARYLALLCHGENHPEIGLIDSNIGLILHAVEEYELSLRFLEHALTLNIRYFGPGSLKVAMNYHLVARTHSCRGDFRAALHSEKEAFTIYKRTLGEAHERTKESSECLKHLTQQAVVLQKKMNEIYKGDKSISFPPIQIQTPSLQSVLETLNIINGIVFVQISQEELDKFRNEMARRQPTDKEDDSKAGEANDLKELTDGSEEGVVVERKEMEFDVDDTVPTVTNGNVKLEQTQELLVGEGR
ncbi:clustered mitochondria protein homolog [Littorina saxatilis]|uniref:Clustered mitochondria protein homolog n=1 Tax=Littorina saxatilis TaxID=31220 RepID=A0AAN9FVM7_9CAEN